MQGGVHRREECSRCGAGRRVPGAQRGGGKCPHLSYHRPGRQNEYRFFVPPLLPPRRCFSLCCGVLGWLVCSSSPSQKITHLCVCVWCVRSSMRVCVLVRVCCVVHACRCVRVHAGVCACMQVCMCVCVLMRVFHCIVHACVCVVLCHDACACAHESLLSVFLEERKLCY